jgi:hypothetical protein
MRRTDGNKGGSQASPAGTREGSETDALEPCIMRSRAVPGSLVAPLPLRGRKGVEPCGEFQTRGLSLSRGKITWVRDVVRGGTIGAPSSSSDWGSWRVSSGVVGVGSVLERVVYAARRAGVEGSRSSRGAAGARPWKSSSMPESAGPSGSIRRAPAAIFFSSTSPTLMLRR